MSDQSNPLSDRPSIAVLSFANLSGDPAQDYLAEGVAEAIISRVRWFFVIARSSSFAYKGKATGIRQIGRDLGVRYILDGSIRKSSKHLRIAGSLVDAETGRHLWADRFDGDESDIFDLQDRITTSVVSAIEPNILSAEIGRSHVKPTDNLNAYDLYLRALPYIYSYTNDDFLEAEKLLRGARLGRQVLRRLDGVGRLPRAPNDGRLARRLGRGTRPGLCRIGSRG